MKRVWGLVVLTVLAATAASPQTQVFRDRRGMPIYQLKPSIEALRLGIDFVLYSLTH
jgi:hypothetical protein